ncbi:MAG TPA: hypothetical protein VHB79_01670 [Polyangiaceae bacterium]|nr:hypothetical protein [Polyangiaceae bacterium]
MGCIAVAACSPYRTDADSDSNENAAGSPTGEPALERFSFFYTSLAAMRRLSGSDDGFGGDLRFGTGSGLEGADKICQTIAQDAGSSKGTTWRAFLSAVHGPDSRPVNAVDRIGPGPWHDRKGRLIAADAASLIAERPNGDAEAVNDLPDETGQGTMGLGTSYDVITGSNKLGLLKYDDPKDTCMDWSDDMLDNVQVTAGHTWLAGGIGNWIDAHAELSCRAGVKLDSPGVSDGTSIGAGGGWGGFYCFALAD